MYTRCSDVVVLGESQFLELSLVCPTRSGEVDRMTTAKVGPITGEHNTRNSKNDDVI